MTTKVVNLRHSSYDVYIGRPDKWGNPFTIGVHGARSDVIRKYRTYILKRKDLLDSLEELRNKTLGCYCKPKACHGDILVELLNNANSN